MKKLLSLLALGFSIIFLASCSNKDSLSGKYYDIYDGEAELVIEFTDKGGKFYKEGTHAITDADTKKQSFTFSSNGTLYLLIIQRCALFITPLTLREALEYVTFRLIALLGYGSA